MATRIAINGFGRIGRLVLRALCESKRDDLEVVAINDLGRADANAHLLRYDSIHGIAPFDVDSVGDTIHIKGLGGKGEKKNIIQVFAKPDPATLPWADCRVDIVFECTGRFTNRGAASAHLKAGAGKVLVSAPCSDSDITVVYGVNDADIDATHKIVSNASCTTNCLAPPVSVLAKEIGFVRGFMTTVHAMTGDQPSVDTLHKDWRRARAASVSMIPTSTGAARAVALVLPHLSGRLDGCAIRVPTANVSMVDLTFDAGCDVTVDAVNDAMRQASKTHLKDVLDVCDQPLVSCDFNHNPASSIVDLNQTQVSDKRLCRILAWYDNEWGFSNRMLDVAAKMAAC